MKQVAEMDDQDEFDALVGLEHPLTASTASKRLVNAYVRDGLSLNQAILTVNLHLASGAFDEYYQQRFPGN
jgi:hypothetical protein